jgi:hypothetical protein
MVNRVFGGTTSGSGGYTLRYHVAELSMSAKPAIAWSTGGSTSLS